MILGIINKEKTFQFCREVVSVEGTLAEVFLEGLDRRLSGRQRGAAVEVLLGVTETSCC